MYFDSPMLFSAISLLVFALVIALVAVLAVVLIRLILAATRALDAYTSERKLRVDLLLSDDSDI